MHPPRPRCVSLFLLLSACSSVGGSGPGGGTGDGDGDGTGDGNGDGDSDCAQVEPVEFAPGESPDLLLVVDKSGSMEDSLANGDVKWDAMRDALISVVGQYDDGIRFGLMLYPQDDVCAAGGLMNNVQAQNGTAIATTLNSTVPEGGTPTHTTMTAAGTYFQGLAPSGGARYALLATDGEPNCGSLADPTIPTENESIAAIEQLTGTGVKTFVLGFGGAVNNFPDTLQAMAVAGGTGEYFAANSPQELAAALDAIASEVGLPSCSFVLDRVPGDPSQLSVSQDGASIPRDTTGAEGWNYDAASNSITFSGQACEDIRAGNTTEIRVDFGCGPVE